MYTSSFNETRRVQSRERVAHNSHITTTLQSPWDNWIPTNKHRDDRPLDSELKAALHQSTLRLKSSFSDIVHRHSTPLLGPTSQASSSAPPPPSLSSRWKPLSTRALLEDEDDIIDLSTMEIVQDRGILRGLKPGLWQLGGDNKDDDDDDSSSPEDDGNQVRQLNRKDARCHGQSAPKRRRYNNNKGPRARSRPQRRLDTFTDSSSEDEIAAIDTLESQPSLQYLEERLRQEEDRRDMLDFMRAEQAARARGTSSAALNPDCGPISGRRSSSSAPVAISGQQTHSRIDLVAEDEWERNFGMLQRQQTRGLNELLGPAESMITGLGRQVAQTRCRSSSVRAHDHNGFLRVDDEDGEDEEDDELSIIDLPRIVPRPLVRSASACLARGRRRATSAHPANAKLSLSSPARSKSSVPSSRTKPIERRHSVGHNSNGNHASDKVQYERVATLKRDIDVSSSPIRMRVDRRQQGGRTKPTNVNASGSMTSMSDAPVKSGLAINPPRRAPPTTRELSPSLVRLLPQLPPVPLPLLPPLPSRRHEYPTPPSSSTLSVLPKLSAILEDDNDDDIDDNWRDRLPKLPPSAPAQQVLPPTPPASGPEHERAKITRLSTRDRARSRSVVGEAAPARQRQHSFSLVVDVKPQIHPPSRDRNGHRTRAASVLETKTHATAIAVDRPPLSMSTSSTRARANSAVPLGLGRQAPTRATAARRVKRGVSTSAMGSSVLAPQLVPKRRTRSKNVEETDVVMVIPDLDDDVDEWDPLDILIQPIRCTKQTQLATPPNSSGSTRPIHRSKRGSSEVHQAGDEDAESEDELDCLVAIQF